MQTHKQIIFRDDDIAFAHTAHAGELVMDEKFLYRKFIEVDSLFKKYEVKHTVAVIAKDIDKAGMLVDYILRQTHIDVQLHCYTHEIFTSLSARNLDYQFKDGVRKIKEVFGIVPTVFYPPYNSTSPKVSEIAFNNKLQTSYDKMSLSGYLRGHQKDVINFHYWADECCDLEAALKKYTNK